MNPIFWIIVALLVASLLVAVTAAQTRRSLPPVELPGGESLPRTALQRYAGRTLVVVVLMCAVAAGMVVHFGAQVWWDSDAVRLTVTFLLLAALAAYIVFTFSIRSLEARSDGSFDERDSAILARSTSGVGGAMMVVVAAWMIGLTEAHIATRLVPSYYLYLIFWSCVMTNVIASIGGILLAYRRS